MQLQAKLVPSWLLTGQASTPVTDLNLDLETFMVLNAASLLLIIYLSPTGNVMNNSSAGSGHSKRGLKGEADGVFM